MLRHLRPKLSADFVSVELADTFQTLSKRLEAMKHVRPESRSLFIVSSVAIALLGVVAVVPWKLVAQDAQAVDVPEIAERSTTVPAEPNEAELKQAARIQRSTDLIERLIGTWQGGHVFDGIVEFRGDGTFRETPRTLTLGTPKDVLYFPGADSVQGTGWGVSNHDDEPRLFAHYATLSSIFRGLPELPLRPGQFLSPDYCILHLDDDLLRIQGRSGEVLFFRRVKAQPPKTELSDQLRDDVRLLAKIADLTNPEAEVLERISDDWFKTLDATKDELEALARLVAAKKGEIDFAELAQFETAESEAYANLFTLTSGDLRRMQALRSQKQLTSSESAAVKKVSQFVETVSNALPKVVHGVSDARLAENRTSPQSLTPGPQLSPERLWLNSRLNTKFNQVERLSQFLNSCFYPRNR